MCGWVERQAFDGGYVAPAMDLEIAQVGFDNLHDDKLLEEPGDGDED
jgi:hypothetical protein